jgi:hypothetical protein
MPSTTPDEHATLYSTYLVTLIGAFVIFLFENVEESIRAGHFACHYKHLSFVLAVQFLVGSNALHETPQLGKRQMMLKSIRIFVSPRWYRR